MIRRIGLGAIALLLLSGMAHAQSSADQRCSAGWLEIELAAALEACKAVLAREDLTDAARAAAMKIEARALHRLGRLDEAILGYEGALRLAPDDPELHLRRGWTAYDKRDLERVFDLAQQALKLKPDYAEAYDLIGAAHAVSGPEKFAGAKAAYQQAVRLDPSEPMPRWHLYQLLRQDYPAEALREIEALLQLPAVATTKVNGVIWANKQTSFRIGGNLARALLLKSLGRTNEARQAVDQAIKDDPQDGLTWAWRAESNLSSASEAVVQADVDRALALDPDHWFARYVQAKVHFYGKRYDAAAADFAIAAKLDPKLGNVRWWHAQTLRELGRVEEASAQAIAAFRVDPNFIYRKASALQKRGYLVAVPPGQDPWPAIDDAARACMLDKDCG